MSSFRANFEDESADTRVFPVGTRKSDYPYFIVKRCSTLERRFAFMLVFNCKNDVSLLSFVCKNDFPSLGPRLVFMPSLPAHLS